MATHNSITSVLLELDAAPAQPFSFGRLALFRDLVLATELGGARFKDFTATEAATDASLGASTKAVLARIFAQSPTLASVRVVGFDSSAGTPETPEDGYDALIALSQEDSFYAAHLTYAPAGGSPAVTYVTDLADKLLDRGYGLLFVDTTATNAYSGVLADSDLDGVEGYTNIVWGFNDRAPSTDLHMADAAARFLARNHDLVSPPMVGPINATALTATLTESHRTQLLANNGSVALPFSTAPAFMYPMKAADGRQALQVFIRDYLQIRMNEDIAAWYLAAATRGEIIPVSAEGLRLGRSIIEARLSSAVSLGKVLEGQYIVEDGIANVATTALSWTVRATNVTEALSFTVTGDVTRNNVVV